MILNSKTRQYIKLGTILKSKQETEKSYRYKVTNMLQCGKGLQVTVQIISNDVWNHRNIYMQPLSNYYGLEIVND